MSQRFQFWFPFLCKENPKNSASSAGACALIVAKTALLLIRSHEKPVTLPSSEAPRELTELLGFAGVITGRTDHGTFRDSFWARFSLAQKEINPNRIADILQVF